MKKIHYLFIISFFILSCNNTSKKTTESVPLENLMESSSEENWVSLIQDNTMDGWHYYQDDGNKTGWDIKDGILTFTSANASGEGDKSLVSDKEYTSFKIHLEWKVSSMSNSGFFWGVKEDMKYEFPFVTGPEIQILDPEMPDGPLTQAGALYGMIAPSKWVTKPAGEWNTSKIKYTEEKVEHWMNGELIVSFTPYSEDWYERRNSGKWDEYPDYGKFKKGYIALQDHDSPIWFREIKIKKL